jgi:hypothetical protein
MAEANTVITNTISTGAGENELYLTYTFQWDFPSIKEGSEEANEKERQLAEQGAQGVPYAIDTIRAMVQEGKL